VVAGVRFLDPERLIGALAGFAGSAHIFDALAEPVPEPSTLSLSALGLFGLRIRRKLMHVLACSPAKAVACRAARTTSEKCKVIGFR
jgi:hypothetical protein